MIHWRRELGIFVRLDIIRKGGVKKIDESVFLFGRKTDAVGRHRADVADGVGSSLVVLHGWFVSVCGLEVDGGGQVQAGARRELIEITDDELIFLIRRSCCGSLPSNVDRRKVLA